MNSTKALLVKAAALLWTVAVSVTTGWCAMSPVSFSFTNTATPIYDLSGTYQFDQQVLGPGGVAANLSLSLAVQQDMAGGLSGSGTATVQLGDASAQMQYTLKGRVSGGGIKATRATVLVRCLEQDTTAGAKKPLSIVALYNLKVGSDGLNGLVRGSVKNAQFGNGHIKSSISGMPLAQGTNGSWSVQMNIEASRMVGGTGTILLASGRSLAGNLAGTVSPHAKLTSLKLMCGSGNQGATLKINFAPTTGAVRSLNGKLLGQTVSLKFSAQGKELPSVSGNFIAAAAATYAGSQACIECHGPLHDSVMTQGHGLRGVQCEDCHGPAANHAANPYDPVSRPNLAQASSVCAQCHTSVQHPDLNKWYGSAHAGTSGSTDAASLVQGCAMCHTDTTKQQPLYVGSALNGVSCGTCHDPHTANDFKRADIAATTCATCHSGPQHPIFEDWSASAHSGMVEDMSPTNRISSCGRCHSGSVRLSMVKGESLPAEANVPIVCVTCHDQHAAHVWTNALTGVQYTNQLRNPVSSTNDYFLSTSDNFATKYNPNINLCAQCHNHRGASWTSSSRPPHHSAQYNMLLGTVGEMTSGQRPYQPGGHALTISDQCVGCHMQPSTNSQPVLTGHHFKVEQYDRCQECHSLPELLVEFTQGAVSNRVQELKVSLNLWAATKAPAALWTKYGTRAWEYTTPGDLSSDGSATVTGPDATEQAQIPDNIKKARFNIYLVLYDGSLGVHNGPYTISLLDAAESWIQAELNK